MALPGCPRLPWLKAWGYIFQFSFASPCAKSLPNATGPPGFFGAAGFFGLVEAASLAKAAFVIFITCFLQHWHGKKSKIMDRRGPVQLRAGSNGAVANFSHSEENGGYV
ncbi:MAG: hypothetical protein WCF59_01640 [Desulfobaccales bacterium]